MFLVTGATGFLGSHLSDRFIKDPAEVLKLDQKIMVRVVDIDVERKRIQLSMKEG